MFNNLLNFRGFDLSDIGSGLTNKLSNFLNDNSFLVEPVNKDIMPLKLDITGNETIILSSDVTDNYTENNIAYQDHITLKPKIYTVEGDIGEVVWYKNDSSSEVLSAVEDKLSPVGSFFPSVSRGFSKIQDKAMKALNFVDSVDNFVDRFINITGKEDESTAQRRAYKYFCLLWGARVPVNVSTPWRSLPNMVITNVEFSQNRATSEKTNIKISFKEFRQTKTKIVAFDESKFQGRLLQQASNIVSLGTTTGSTVTEQMCKAMNQCPFPPYNTQWR